MHRSWWGKYSIVSGQSDTRFDNSSFHLNLGRPFPAWLIHPFLVPFFSGALIHIVEIDPLVISASVRAMGFPSYAIMAPSGERACPDPNDIDKLLWKGTHERLLLHECDAEKFIPQSSTIYDLVFIDAYDGDDIFPHKLWDTHSPFLEALGNQLHPEHGTVVVNLHSTDNSSNLPTMRMGVHLWRIEGI